MLFDGPILQLLASKKAALAPLCTINQVLPQFYWWQHLICGPKNWQCSFHHAPSSVFWPTNQVLPPIIKLATGWNPQNRTLKKAEVWITALHSLAEGRRSYRQPGPIPFGGKPQIRKLCQNMLGDNYCHPRSQGSSAQPKETCFYLVLWGEQPDKCVTQKKICKKMPVELVIFQHGRPQSKK